MRQIVRNRPCASFGEKLVMLMAARRVGVPEDVDIGLVVAAEGARDIVEDRMELRLHFPPVNVECYARRHAQDQIVALAHHVDPGAGRLAPEICLLAVHVGADGTARDGADAGADQLLGAIVAAADEVTEQIAGDGAAGDADCSPVDPLLAGVRVGGAGSGAERRQSDGGRERLSRTHSNSPFLIRPTN